MSREMTNKEAIANLNHIYGIVSPDIQRSLDLAIKALEENEFLEDLKGGCAGCRIITKLDQARRPQGEWTDDNEENKYPLLAQGWKCSICGTRQTYGKTDFCPYCGADMRGEEK